MRKIFVVITSLIGITIFNSSVYAFAFCDREEITAINVSADGKLFLSFSGLGNNLLVCNVDSPLERWSPAACKALQATALAAMLSKKKVAVWFEKKSNCSAIGNWSVISGGDFDFYHLKVCNGLECGG